MAGVCKPCHKHTADNVTNGVVTSVLLPGPLHNVNQVGEEVVEGNVMNPRLQAKEIPLPEQTPRQHSDVLFHDNAAMYTLCM